MDLHKHRAGAYLKGAGKAADEPKKPKEPAKSPAAAPKGGSSKAANKAMAGLIKAKSSAPPSIGRDQPAPPARAPDPGFKPSRQDIAKYLVIIGTEEASSILQHLEETEVEALAREIQAIQFISADEAASILDKFKGLVKTGRIGPASGGLDRAKSILVNAFGEVRGQQILKQAVPSKEEPLFGYLADLDPAQIHGLLRPESAPVKSIVLACIPPASAAAILKLLPAEEQQQIIRRLAGMKRIDKEVLVRIDEALRQRLHDSANANSEEVDGRSSLANIMRHLDPTLEQALLTSLATEDPDLAREIGDRLFTIDTLLLIDDRDLQRLFAGLENRHIAVLLKGKSEEIRRKILSNISESRAGAVSEDYKLMGPQPKREVNQATREFIATLKQLESEGKIVVRREDEEYV